MDGIKKVIGLIMTTLVFGGLTSLQEFISRDNKWSEIKKRIKLWSEVSDEVKEERKRMQK